MKKFLDFCHSEFLVITLFLFLTLSIIGCAGVAYRTGAREYLRNPPPVESVKRGAIVYAQFCLECHGPNAMGNGPKADKLQQKPANLKASGTHLTRFGMLTIVDYPHYSSRTIQTSIHKGRNSMPSLDGKLTQEEIQDVTNYIVDQIHMR